MRVKPKGCLRKTSRSNRTLLQVTLAVWKEDNAILRLKNSVRFRKPSVATLAACVGIFLSLTRRFDSEKFLK